MTLQQLIFSGKFLLKLNFPHYKYDIWNHNLGQNIMDKFSKLSKNGIFLKFRQILSLQVTQESHEVTRIFTLW